jgi:hypothetical protein
MQAQRKTNMQTDRQLAATARVTSRGSNVTAERCGEASIRQPLTLPPAAAASQFGTLRLPAPPLNLRTRVDTTSISNRHATRKTACCAGCQLSSVPISNRHLVRLEINASPAKSTSSLFLVDPNDAFGHVLYALFLLATSASQCGRLRHLSASPPPLDARSGWG